jgi:hypothetical protein
VIAESVPVEAPSKARDERVYSAAPPPASRPSVHVPAPAQDARASVPHPTRSRAPLPPWALLLALLLLAALAVLVYRALASGGAPSPAHRPAGVTRPAPPQR